MSKQSGQAGIRRLVVGFFTGASGDLRLGGACVFLAEIMSQRGKKAKSWEELRRRGQENSVVGESKKNLARLVKSDFWLALLFIFENDQPEVVEQFLTDSPNFQETTRSRRRAKSWPRRLSLFLNPSSSRTVYFFLPFVLHLPPFDELKKELWFYRKKDLFFQHKKKKSIDGEGRDRPGAGAMKFGVDHRLPRVEVHPFDGAADRSLGGDLEEEGAVREGAPPGSLSLDAGERDVWGEEEGERQVARILTGQTREKEALEGRVADDQGILEFGLFPIRLFKFDGERLDPGKGGDKQGGGDPDSDEVKGEFYVLGQVG